ncbi:MAG: TolC family protein [Gemmatimonadota bacterium]|jgi:outer membrane protein TolC
MNPLILTAAVVLGAWQQAPSSDTLIVRAETAFDMALEAAPRLEASRRRTSAAEALLRQSGAWSNPVLSVTAENLGATRPISGVAGVQGVEGQAVLSGLLPVGGDRGAAQAAAGARLLEARSLEAGTEADLRRTVVGTLARAARDDERLRRAREEVDGLEALASALAAQADLGRASAGEAARAHLAMVSAHTVAAEVAGEAAASREELALLLGLRPGAPLKVELPVCQAQAHGAEAPVAAPTAGRPPDVLAASARLQAATADVSRMRAARVPDLMPQVGVRRAAGISALYLGISMELPFFNRGSASVQAALAEEAASTAELMRVERAVAAQREAARQGVVALESVGARYTAEWAAALDQAVRSAEARYRVGEGTLTELLDGRRARLQALDDYERWRAELFSRRAELARLSGETIDASTLCGAPLPREPHISEGRP